MTVKVWFVEYDPLDGESTTSAAKTWREKANTAKKSSVTTPINLKLELYKEGTRIISTLSHIMT